jgi:hypothetical protein
LLSTTEDQLRPLLNGELLTLRKRYDALLQVLDRVGCVILRRGTIEDYYGSQQLGSIGKPEAAAAEMEALSSLPIELIRERYDDVVRAIQIAAPLKPPDENALLRAQLGGLLGTAMLIVQPGMSDDELNSRAAMNVGTEAPVFRLSNLSSGGNTRIRRIEVSITSPLFARDGFPFQIADTDNLTATIEQKLPSVPNRITV